MPGEAQHEKGSTELSVERGALSFDPIWLPILSPDWGVKGIGAPNFHGQKRMSSHSELQVKPASYPHS
jgi:hypothetical protein